MRKLLFGVGVCAIQPFVSLLPKNNNKIMWEWLLPQPATATRPSGDRNNPDSHTGAEMTIGVLAVHKTVPFYD